MSTIATPDEATLRSFLLGTLPPEEAERIAAWATDNPTATELFNQIVARDTLTEIVSDTDVATPVPPAIISGIITAVNQAVGAGPNSSLSEASTHPDGRTLPPPGPPDEIPARLGDYRVIRELGRGGMGVVYEAIDERLHRRVALKVVRPEHAAIEQVRERFFREARAVAALKSDYIVTIFQVGETESGPFLAMEYLDGMTLDLWLKDRPVPASMGDVFWIARDVLSGLATAHAKGLVHRDIKPANLWVDRDTGRVKVLDFGLTRSVDAGEPITREGVVVGTPAYMAPEQANGKPLDPRADLFSVGVVLYRMLAGRSPFQRESLLATLSALATDIPAQLDGARPELSEFISRLLAKNPADRPVDAKAALAELRLLEDRLKAQPLPASTPATAVADSRRRPRPIWRVAGFLGACVVVGVVAQWIIIRDKDGKEVAKLKVNSGDKPSIMSLDGKEESLVPAPVSPKKDVSPIPLPRGANPLDALDPAKIPAAERFPWQPKELVAVIGEHRQRWESLQPLDQKMITSTDGKQILVPNGSGDQVIWDISIQREIRRFPLRLPNGVRNIAHWGGVSFTPDGSRLVTSDRVWDITGTEPKEIAKIPDLGLGDYVRFIPDGKTAVSAGSGDVRIKGELDRSFVTLWDISDTGWKIRHRFPNTTQFSLSPDGTKIAVGAVETGTVRVYSLAKYDPVEIAALPLPADAVPAKFSKNTTLGFVSDDRLVTYREGILRLWDISMKLPRELTQSKTKCEQGLLAVPATKKFIVFDGNVSAAIWDANGDKLTQTGGGSWDNRVASNTIEAAVSPDGKALVTTHLNGSMRFWDIGEKELVERKPLAIQPHSRLNGETSLALSDRHLFLRTELNPVFNPHLGLWDLAGPSPVHVKNVKGYFPNLSPNGSRFIANDDRLPSLSAIYENKNGATICLHRLPFQVFACDWSKDSRIVALTVDGAISVYDLTSDPPQERCRLDLKLPPSSETRLFFLQPDGSRLLMFDQDAGAGPTERRITLFSVANGSMKRLSQTTFKAEQHSDAAVSPDGKTLLLPDGRRWDVSGDEPRPLSDVSFPGGARAVQFLPDSRTVVFVGRGVVGLFDLEKNRPVQAPWDFVVDVKTLTVTLDGRYLITGNANGTIYVLRLPTLSAKGP